MSLGQEFEKNNPAFPLVIDESKVATAWMGMSLRDYFAAQALPALIARPVYWVNDGYPHPETTAKAAYEMADAMIKAREEDKK